MRMVMILMAMPVGPGAWAAQKPAPAPSPSSQPASLAPPKSDEIPDLLAMLGHPKYKNRQQATDRLKLVPREEITGPLAKLYRTTRDHEVKLRVKEIAQAVFLKEHEEGFLGVALETKLLTHDRDPRLRTDTVGIRVDQVIPDTAASDAGLRLNDVIIGCDGKALPRNKGDDSTQPFREMIASKGPRARLRMNVLRSHQILEIVVTLRGRPENLWFGDDKRAKLERIEKALQVWWRENFGPADPWSDSE